MQKVEGSNPFSRSGKGLHLQVFFVDAVGWCVCIAGHPRAPGGHYAAGATRAHLTVVGGEAKVESEVMIVRGCS
jgi:hypothetical protein